MPLALFLAWKHKMRNRSSSKKNRGGKKIKSPTHHLSQGKIILFARSQRRSLAYSLSSSELNPNPTRDTSLKTWVEWINPPRVSTIPLERKNYSLASTEGWVTGQGALPMKTRRECSGEPVPGAGHWVFRLFVMNAGDAIEFGWGLVNYFSL